MTYIEVDNMPDEIELNELDLEFLEGSIDGVKELNNIINQLGRQHRMYTEKIKEIEKMLQTKAGAMEQKLEGVKNNMSYIRNKYDVPEDYILSIDDGSFIKEEETQDNSLLGEMEGRIDELAVEKGEIEEEE